jgi:hypothetical protein
MSRDSCAAVTSNSWLAACVTPSRIKRAPPAPAIPSACAKAPPPGRAPWPLVERKAHRPLSGPEPERRLAFREFLRYSVLRFEREYCNLRGNRSNEVEEFAIRGNRQLLAVRDARARKTLRRAVANQFKRAARCNRKYISRCWSRSWRRRERPK